jgi:hypothetical protein
MRITMLFLVIFTGFRLFAQQPSDPALAFDAASVRLATEESIRFQGRRIQTSPGSLFTHGLTLRGCIMWA